MTEEKGIENYQFSNWSLIHTCFPSKYFEPKNIEGLREIIYLAKESGKKIRVVGAGKSPNDIVCTTDYLVSLKNFNKVLSIDEQRQTAKVEAGITFAELNPILEKKNLSLTVLGSISDITVAGAISCAVHGSGLKFSVVSNYVIELDLLTSSGDLIKCTKEENNELLHSVLGGLGAFGIIVNVVLKVETLFHVHSFIQTVTLDEIIDDIYEYLESDYPKIYWFPHTDHVIVNHCNRIYNAKPTKLSIIDRITNYIINYGLGYYALEFCYYIASFMPRLIPFINRTFFKIVFSKQDEIVQVSHESFKLECLFKQMVNEWSIPFESTSLALLQLRRFFETNKDVFCHFPVEIRFVKGDELYLSPAYGRNSCYINILSYKPYGKETDYKKYWEFYESIMRELGGRPNWCKNFLQDKTSTGDFIKMYPMFRVWLQTKKRIDPINMFSNNFLENIFKAK